MRCAREYPASNPGRIVRAAYLGSHMEYQIIADGLDKELFVIDAAVAMPKPHGAEVAITLLETGASVVVPS